MNAGKGSKGGKSERGKGDRDLGVRLKTAHKRTLSSQRWLERQLNDPFVARAKREGYRSRAAFKLLEIDDKYKLLKPAQRIVDLGAAPGGWSQIAAKKVGSDKGRGAVAAIDLLEIEPIAGVDFNRYHIDGLDVTLQPGKYWVMMHVNAYVELSETDGTGGIGGPLGNGNAFLTSPWHSNAFLQAIPPTGNFAYGIEGSAVPEPASMSLYVAGLTLMGIKRRRRITRL